MACHKWGIQGSEVRKVSVTFQPHLSIWRKIVNIGEPPCLVIWTKANIIHIYMETVGQVLYPKASPSKLCSQPPDREVRNQLAKVAEEHTESPYDQQFHS